MRVTDSFPDRIQAIIERFVEEFRTHMGISASNYIDRDLEFFIPSYPVKETEPFYSLRLLGHCYQSPNQVPLLGLFSKIPIHNNVSEIAPSFPDER